MTNQIRETASTGNAGLLTRAELSRMLVYDPKTGWISWRIARGGTARAGSAAGCVSPDGYRIIRVAGRNYRAHRIAWLLTHGEWPPNEIDHANGVRADNRIINLRLATASQNRHNSRRPHDNTSGIKGVSWATRDGKWRAQIMVDGRKRRLGDFTSKDKAAAAYRLAAETHFGAFARLT